MSPRNLPPIILLVLDAAGASHFSLYGYQRPTTPCLERLAPETAVYRHCFTTAPWTVPAHVSLFTGLYPHEHGANTTLTGMPEDLYTLPEVLREMGYRTIGISSNLLVSRPLGFHRGFDKFYEMTSLFQEPQYLHTRSQYLRAKKNLKGDRDKIKYIWRYIKESGDFAFPAKKVIDRYYKKYFGDTLSSSAFMTCRSMRLTKKLVKHYQENGTPFFLFINLMETHGRYKAPAPFNRKFLGPGHGSGTRFYNEEHKELVYVEDPQLREELAAHLGLGLDQEILFTDSVIGDFYEFLRRQGLWDRMLFIVTSDHGGGLGEHNLFAHFFGLHNELIHVPLIIKYPRDYGIAGDITRLAQLNDIFATLLQVADSPLPVPFSSHSLFNSHREFALAGLLDNRRGIDYLRRRFSEFKVWSCMLPGLALVVNDLWKLIRWEDGAEELYDLNRDPVEKINLIKDPGSAEKAGALRSTLANFLVS